MNNAAPSIDISNMPDLVHLVKEMGHSQQPHILKRDHEPVALLMPMETPSQRHATLEALPMQPLGQMKDSLSTAGYPELEVNDMLEALSELPQYAGTNQTLNKSR